MRFKEINDHFRNFVARAYRYPSLQKDVFMSDIMSNVDDDKLLVQLGSSTFEFVDKKFGLKASIVIFLMKDKPSPSLAPDGSEINSFWYEIETFFELSMGWTPHLGRDVFKSERAFGLIKDIQALALTFEKRTYRDVVVRTAAEITEAQSRLQNKKLKDNHNLRRAISYVTVGMKVGDPQRLIPHELLESVLAGTYKITTISDVGANVGYIVQVREGATSDSFVTKIFLP